MQFLLLSARCLVWLLNKRITLYQTQIKAFADQSSDCRQSIELLIKSVFVIWLNIDNH